MEPASATLARTRVPISSNPCSGLCNKRVSWVTTTRSSSSSPPAISSYGLDGANRRSVSHSLDIGGCERGRKTTPPTINLVGCSSPRSLLENLEGSWFRDQPRIVGSTHSSSFGNASPASTSGNIHRWGGKKTKRNSRMCRCGSEELDPEDTSPTNERSSRATPGGSQADQTAASRAGTLESELFLYTV